MKCNTKSMAADSLRPVKPESEPPRIRLVPATDVWSNWTFGEPEGGQATTWTLLHVHPDDSWTMRAVWQNLFSCYQRIPWHRRGGPCLQQGRRGSLHFPLTLMMCQFTVCPPAHPMSSAMSEMHCRSRLAITKALLSPHTFFSCLHWLRGTLPLRPTTHFPDSFKREDQNYLLLLWVVIIFWLISELYIDASFISCPSSTSRKHFLLHI